MQVTHKVGSIEFCYIFLTFILLQRNTPCHCMKPASVFGVLNALLHLLKMKSKWLSQALILKKILTLLMLWRGHLDLFFVFLNRGLKERVSGILYSYIS